MLYSPCKKMIAINTLFYKLNSIEQMTKYYFKNPLYNMI